MAEDSDALIVRGYECYNKKTKVTLDFGFDIKSAEICDMMENSETELCVDKNSVTFTAKPFEIVTLKIQ